MAEKNKSLFSFCFFLIKISAAKLEHQNRENNSIQGRWTE